MPAPVRLATIDGENVHPKKSHRIATSASLSLTTTFQDIVTYTINGVAGSGAWLDIGNNPAVDIILAFTHSTDETLTILPVFANADDRTVDPTVGAPPPYIPAATATGVTPAYPNQLTFTKTDWSTTTSPMSSATVKYVRAVLKSNGCRLVKFMAKSNGSAGTLVAYVSAATQE